MQERSALLRDGARLGRLVRRGVGRGCGGRSVERWGVPAPPKRRAVGKLGSSTTTTRRRETPAETQYVGVDLHRRPSVIVRTTATGEPIETVQIDNDPLTLAEVVGRAGEHPEVVLEATDSWVRHKAPHDRVGGQSPTSGRSQQAAEAGGSLTSETRGKVGAASTTPRRVGTARQPGPGKQDGEVDERRNQWWNPLESVGPAGNLVDGRESSAPDSLTTREKGLGGVRAGGHGEGLRRRRGHACRGKAGHRSRRLVCGERGNRLLVANLPISQIGAARHVVR